MDSAPEFVTFPKSRKPQNPTVFVILNGSGKWYGGRGTVGWVKGPAKPYNSLRDAKLACSAMYRPHAAFRDTIFEAEYPSGRVVRQVGEWPVAPRLAATPARIRSFDMAHRDLRIARHRDGHLLTPAAQKAVDRAIDLLLASHREESK